MDNGLQQSGGGSATGVLVLGEMLRYDFQHSGGYSKWIVFIPRGTAAGRRCVSSGWAGDVLREWDGCSLLLTGFSSRAGEGSYRCRFWQSYPVRLQ